MLKNALKSIARRSSLKFKPNTYQKRQVVLNMIDNDMKSKSYNPRTAKYRSLKDVFEK